jgi:transcriptional regulator with XRE-family HTH domain
MDDLKYIVAKNIAALRTRSRLTQFELGEKLSYSDKAISKWERAEAVPDAYVLKQMSELFSVSVDYLLSDHSGEAEPVPVDPGIVIHRAVTKLSFICVWTVALFTFIVLWILGIKMWLLFAYALPASLIVLLVLNSIWGTVWRNFYIISALVWSVIAAIYLSFLQYDWWLLFVLGVPAEFIIYFCFKIVINRKKSKLG